MHHLQRSSQAFLLEYLAGSHSFIHAMLTTFVTFFVAEIKLHDREARAMAKGLGALASLVEESGSIPSTHILTHSHQ